MAKFIFRKKIKENPPEKEDNPVKEKKKIKKAENTNTIESKECANT